ncbi:MAG: hypothetical protein R2849_04925 [Thermomicrobiales bacterium]
MIHVSSRRPGRAECLVMATLLLIPAIALANGTPIRVQVACSATVLERRPRRRDGTVEDALPATAGCGDIEGLPVRPDSHYEIWLYNTKTEEILSLTTFEADDSSATQFDALFDEPIPEDGWDLVVITIEDDPDSSPDPDSRWSLVGTFSGTDVVEAEVIARRRLPRTGSRPGPSDNAAMYGAPSSVARWQRASPGRSVRSREGIRMIRGWYTAASGMVAQMARQLSNAANLANLSTPGYRQVDVQVEEFQNMLLTHFESQDEFTLGDLSTAVAMAPLEINPAQGSLRPGGRSISRYPETGSLLDPDGRGSRYTATASSTSNLEGGWSRMTDSRSTASAIPRSSSRPSVWTRSGSRPTRTVGQGRRLRPETPDRRVAERADRGPAAVIATSPTRNRWRRPIRAFTRGTSRCPAST